MFDRSIPTGSPLSPAQFPEMDTVRGVPVQPKASPFAEIRPDYMDLATTAARSLPTPPPRKKSNIWDREHISETLAGIGAGFFASKNFGDGLGAAAQTIAGRTRQLREEGRPDISYGGPNDQFEISTDRTTGQRTIREVPEFRAANERLQAAKNQPSAKDQADLRGRALYAIATQIPPERRAEAYRNLMANPEQFGIDTTGMPAEWDETYGTLGGMMGLNVNQSLSQERANMLAKDTLRHRKVQEDQGAQRVAEGQRHNRVSEGQRDRQLRKPPASVLKPKISSSNSDLSYLLK